MAASQQTAALGYKPLEYWKGPKAVYFPAEETTPKPPGDRHHQKDHRRSRPIQPAQPEAAQQHRRHVAGGADDGTAPGSRGSVGNLAAHHVEHSIERRASSTAGKTARGAEPNSRFSGISDDDSSLHDYKMAQRFYEEPAPRWYQAGQWRKRTWALVVGLIVIIIVVAVVVPVTLVTKRNNGPPAYPDYSKLNYTLAETYGTHNFFSKFNYLYGVDPSNGFVHYADPGYAATYNLTPTTANSAILRVDTSLGAADASTGRLSARVFSKSTYNKGLFIFDVKHAPTGCGTWPALWLTDASDWPDHGEIDIMEALNRAGTNMVSVHTTNGCSMAVQRLMQGVANSSNCDADVNYNQGCDVTNTPGSFGSAFNTAGGAVMALEWRAQGIRVWQFPRGQLPRDLAAAGNATLTNPDPSTWGPPLADFPSTQCDISSYFKNASITANIDLCGPAMDGGKYESSQCPVNCVGTSYKCLGSDALRNNCTDFVARNPTAFGEAYWEFGAFEVYQAS